MDDQQLVKTMHYFFNAVLKLRQDLRQRMQKKLVERGYSDITFEMMQVLYFLRFLAQKGEANQQEIADETGKNKATLTSLITNLLKRDMIERKTNPDNRRNNIIGLSAKGHQFILDLYPDVYKTYDINKIPLSMDDILSLTNTLNTIINS
ncbi:DNA-binding transcriptional regulator, MarR family [Chitinophaga costaii]|uniref:DNA-binding transcriptional regulator, MarR family n=1 Tax=Chitinophaga costaii TaxID=1335309 RepID=A0A1C4DIT4_9BACT|nr:MarR family winged helix-turn-helix transcriptional regulator [Chitinophaga costaii]PUZ24652.1 MarR family transcriptional regulator [Chitinophaga costaii]SCC31205.1 DNA-binding transcriptional regulator, MarR family [Chitinophaga costaii]